MNAEVFMQKLLTQATLPNKDLALLILATNGIVDLENVIQEISVSEEEDVSTK